MAENFLSAGLALLLSKSQDVGKEKTICKEEWRCGKMGLLVASCCWRVDRRCESKFLILKMRPIVLAILKQFIGFKKNTSTDINTIDINNIIITSQLYLPQLTD